MVVLALPFAYLHFRSGGIATYVFGGVMAGISFVLLNNVLGDLGALQGWQPWFTAALPGLIYSMLSLAAFAWLVITTMTKAIVLFAHGSRDPLWHKPMEAVAAQIATQAPDTPVACAYLELVDTRFADRGGPIGGIWRYRHFHRSHVFGRGPPCPRRSARLIAPSCERSFPIWF